MIITKDGDGNVAAVELQDAGPEEAAALESLGIERQNLLGQEDFEDFGEALDPNSTCGLLVWENVWAAPFVDAVRDADGIMLAAGRIPADVIEDAMASERLLTRPSTRTERKGITTMMRRRGGLVRMAATTAVVAGTAGAVSHHQEQKYANQQQQAVRTAGCRAAAVRRCRACPGRAGGPADGAAREARPAARPGHPDRR